MEPPKAHKFGVKMLKNMFLFMRTLQQLVQKSQEQEIEFLRAFELEELALRKTKDKNLKYNWGLVQKRLKATVV
jgi:hypothetical protein